ncbi:winged helix-turn-helix domain-containing protein [Halogeometricum pallidum]|nr:winged helix-turn-helix domain-containing protein [Halogeometricum pallidum]
MSALEHRHDRHDDELDPIEAMSALDTTTRKNIVGVIVGHPTSTPSKKELAYYLPDTPDSTISSNLSILEEAGIIESASHERADLEKGEPYRFFQLTDAARDLFDRNGLFEEAAYKNLIEQTEKTDDIEAAEGAPRPVFT